MCLVFPVQWVSNCKHHRDAVSKNIWLLDIQRMTRCFNLKSRKGILSMKSGAIRGEQVFQVCPLTTIAILFNNYDDNALSTELKRGTSFSEYTLLFTLPFTSELHDYDRRALFGKQWTGKVWRYIILHALKGFLHRTVITIKSHLCWRHLSGTGWHQVRETTNGVRR